MQLQGTTLCNLSNENIGLDLGANFQLLKAENECLRSWIENLDASLKESAKQIEQLSEITKKLEHERVELKASFKEFTNKNQFEINAHKVLSENILDKQKLIYEGQIATYQSEVEYNKTALIDASQMYEFWTIFIGFIIALSAGVSFYFIKGYKAREIEEMADDAAKKLSEEHMVIRAVSNSLSTEHVQQQLIDLLQSDAMQVEFNSVSEQEMYIRSIVYDILSESEEGNSETYEDVFSANN